MEISGLHYLPLVLFLLFPFTFLGTYLYAVLEGHVEANFPYISDAASYAPESCVFSQFINIGAVLLAILVYVRYCEINQYYEQYAISNNVTRLNKMGLWFGIGSSLGLSIVANFQEVYAKYVHYVGATLCFGAGTAYFWIQAWCSYHMHTLAHSIFLAHFRVGLSMVCTIFFFVSSICGLMSHIQFHGDDPTKWYPTDGGWMLHVISTGSEWIVAICFCVYIFTFYSEFSLISFSHPKVYLSNQRRESATEYIIS